MIRKKLNQLKKIINLESSKQDDLLFVLNQQLSEKKIIEDKVERLLFQKSELINGGDIFSKDAGQIYNVGIFVKQIEQKIDQLKIQLDEKEKELTTSRDSVRQQNIRVKTIQNLSDKVKKQAEQVQENMNNVETVDMIVNQLLRSEL